MALLNNADMHIHQIRRENLAAYCARECGSNQAELSRRMQRKPNQVSDMLAGRKAFGERVAREIEANLGLMPGDLDRVEGLQAVKRHPADRRPGAELLPLFPDEILLLQDFRAFSDVQRQWVMSSVGGAAGCYGKEDAARDDPLGAAPETGQLGRILYMCDYEPRTRKEPLQEELWLG